MTQRRKLALLDVDPDLGRLVPEERLIDARRELDVEVHRLPSGPWKIPGASEANPQHVGLLLVEGVIAREVVVSDTVSTELIGPGDVVRPWSINGSPALLQLNIRWIALTESRVGVLDRRFGAALGRWPEVNAALIDRLSERAQRLAVNQAISQLNRVDRRLMALFWHLAERWGRMSPDGVIVPLTLSHRMLGQLVGARRPTVSTAISDLAKRGELLRRDDGTWLIKGEPVGVPTTEAERIIPIRRHLFGSTPKAPHEPAVAVAEPPLEVAAEAPPSVGTARTELLDTLTRLRSESQTRMDALRTTIEHAGALQQLTIAKRDERARERAERPANGRH
jgi:CRP/FNR family transcriptional regulator, cyclic AMP receptor protein